MQFLDYEQAEDKRDQKLQILVRGKKLLLARGRKLQQHNHSLRSENLKGTLKMCIKQNLVYILCGQRSICRLATFYLPVKGKQKSCLIGLFCIRLVTQKTVGEGAAQELEGLCSAKRFLLFRDLSFNCWVELVYKIQVCHNLGFIGELYFI